MRVIEVEMFSIVFITPVMNSEFDVNHSQKLIKNTTTTNHD